MTLLLITGGSRCGKSAFAERLASQSGYPVTYVATGVRADSTQDPEWAARIQEHQMRRPAQWQTLECGLEMGSLVTPATGPMCYLIDSLGGWVAAGLELDPPTWQDWVDQLCQWLHIVSRDPQTLGILVSEEVGMGVVPAYPMGRLFRDRLGLLTQEVGSQAEKIYWVVAGWAVNLRDIGEPVACS